MVPNVIIVARVEASLYCAIASRDAIQHIRATPRTKHKSPFANYVIGFLTRILYSTCDESYDSIPIGSVVCSRDARAIAGYRSCSDHSFASCGALAWCVVCASIGSGGAWCLGADEQHDADALGCAGAGNTGGPLSIRGALRTSKAVAAISTSNVGCFIRVL